VGDARTALCNWLFARRNGGQFILRIERLSKRHRATSISIFREIGYLTEALVYYLVQHFWGTEDGAKLSRSWGRAVPIVRDHVVHFLGV
jgi:glutamyl/glutaminyl-tRNA synthetase